MDDKDLFINLNSEKKFQSNTENKEDVGNNKHVTFKVIILIIIILGIIFGIIKKNIYKAEQLIAPNISYECEQGYELLYNQCSKTIIKDTNEKHYCSTGYQMIDNECIKYEYVNATKEYEPCPKNYTERYGRCVYEYPVVEPTYDYVCPPNTISKHNTCYLLSHTGTPTKILGSYQCLNMGKTNWYEIRNNTCYYYLDVGKIEANPKCPENYFYLSSPGLKGCHRIDEFEQTYKYVCPNEYNLDSNNICVKVSIQAKKVDRWCEEGYVLSENKCIKTETITPKTIYTCPKNYIYENNICKKIK